MSVCEIHPSAMFGIMFLLHFIADYTLQGCMADLKQWRWWRKQIPEEKEEEWNQYKNDYKMALCCHSAEWSLVVCLPLIMCGGYVYILSAMLNAAIHYVVDDMKANWLKINLIQDQTFHAMQILCIWGTWMIFM